VARKKYKLEILPPARDEILEIARLHLELVGPESARKITARIRESLEHLRTQPLMGMAPEDKSLRQMGYRKLICGHYLCFYRLIGETVFVYHIADGRTEYKQLFRSLPLE
jgi:plasmid stabilization system protein ParE